MAPNFSPKTIQNDAKTVQNDPKTVQNGPSIFFKPTPRRVGGRGTAAAAAAAVAATGPKEPSFIGAIFSKPPLYGTA